MEQTAARRDQLARAYACFKDGSVPTQSSVHVASAVFSCVSGQVPLGDTWELTCLSLSLVKNISCGLLSHRVSADALLSWTETLRLLLEDMDLMSPLVALFQAEDPIISHLAAKTASECVFFDLVKCGKLSPAWQQRCVQAFHASPPAAELDACLWTVTAIFKKLLKGGHQEFLGRLLAAFDCSVRTLFERFLPENTEELMRRWKRCWGTTFCLLLDLLEVLTASSLMCGGETGLTSHTISQKHWSALLTAVSCSSTYFVKKRTLLLLKRALCQRAGEDWSLERAPSRLDLDMSEPARCVLTAVDHSWLQRVPVGAAAFFGGSREPRGDVGWRADDVMLRAVSLLLLKSIELHVQTEEAAWRYLQCLWEFLRQRSPVLTNVTHRCSWISLLFADQDDDLMDAARTSLSIFLRLRRRSDPDSPGVLEAACASGCSPHCHFLLLLQSVSFDHSILLDFLISSETCFLEYLVHYLKYLKEDWQGFTAACGGSAVGSPRLQQSIPASRVPSHTDEPDAVSLGSSGQSVRCEPLVGGSGWPAGLRLVAYDSSDQSEDSEPESSLDVKQEAEGALPPIRPEPSSPPASLADANSTRERTPESSPLPSTSTHEPVAAVSRQETCDALDRAVLCLSELRELLTRLQMKKLFPYNPSSLLKLLERVENCYRHAAPLQHWA
ncbi:protein Lines homolog 1 [Xenentodon cancila]